MSEPHEPPRHAHEAMRDGDGATAAMPAAAPAGNGGWRIGERYRVTDRLGSGGMAEVFRAHDELLNRDVAVKVFKAVPATPDTASGVERQRAELHALARLNHPNLITLYDGSVGEGNGSAYLVMELVEGPTLADRLADGPMSDAELTLLGSQMASALAYVHSEGMVHRDVKPANILLGTDRAGDAESARARLSDFGIVRLLGAERMTSVDFTLGTASYLAPEQARGSNVGPAADIYSLGLTMIEALTGVRSFEGTPIEAAMARLDRDPVVPPDLPTPWTPLLRAMTDRDATQRPTAAEVGRALNDPDAATTPFASAGADDRTTLIPAAGVSAAAVAPVAAYAAPAGSYPVSGAYATPADVYDEPPRERRSPIAWFLAAAALVAFLAVGGILLLNGNNSPSGGSSSTAPSSGVAKPSSTESNKKKSSSSVRTKTSSKASSASTTPSTSASSSVSSSASSSKAPPTTSSPPASSSAASSSASSSSAASSSASSSSSSSSPAAVGPAKATTSAAKSATSSPAAP